MTMHLLEILHARYCPHVRLALTRVRDAISLVGAPLDIELRVVCVDDRADAVRRRLRGSPTIRVDGVDVEGTVVRLPVGTYSRSYAGTELGGSHAPRVDVIARALEKCRYGR